MLEGKEEFFSAEELEKKEYINSDKLEDLYLTVFKKSPMFKELIKAHDEPILKLLKHIELSVYNDKDDFTLTFHFGENEFMEQSQIAVTVVMNEQGQSTEIKSDKVNWKEGKNVTEKTITKKQKNKRTGQQRTTTKTEKQESFFTLFQNLKDDGEDEEENENENENEEDEQPDQFGENEELFTTIKDSVIPYCTASYFGVSVPELEFEDFGGEDDEDFESADSEEEDAKPTKKKGKGGKKSKKASGNDIDPKGGPNQQECKQN